MKFTAVEQYQTELNQIRETQDILNISKKLLGDYHFVNSPEVDIHNLMSTTLL